MTIKDVTLSIMTNCLILSRTTLTKMATMLMLSLVAVMSYMLSVVGLSVVVPL
jgi:hypothetical protein